MIFSKLMLLAVGAGVVNALPILTVPDAQEDGLVDLDSPASQVSIRFLNEDSPKAVLVKYTENGVLKQLHINAHSDSTASYAVDPTKEITILSEDPHYYRVCTVAPDTLKEDDAVSTAVPWGNSCKVSRPAPSPSPAPAAEDLQFQRCFNSQECPCVKHLDGLCLLYALCNTALNYCEIGSAVHNCNQDSDCPGSPVTCYQGFCYYGAQKANGASCYWNYECESTYCNDGHGGGKGKCQALGNTGDDCAWHQACKSFSCHGGKCT